MSEAPPELKKVRLALRAKAINALARREHSCFELQAKLTKVTDSDQQLVHDAIGELVREGLQSDQRFAEQLCRSKINRGFGPARIRYELEQHRIDEALIESAMGEYDGQWSDRLREVKEKKFGTEAAADYKTWAKQARFLQSRGFSSAQIGTVLTKSF